MNIYVKTFEELSLEELYAILQLRAEVFVVEQKCAYQDLDGKDKMALHVFGWEDDQLTAYTRIFKPGDYRDCANIGRVVVRPESRSKGWGKKIMKASVSAIEKRFATQKIHLSAQTYLLKFYAEFGFLPQGEEYLDDGIPHIDMFRT